MDEPLPKAVARQWREWCNNEGYVKAAFGKTVHRHLYDDLLTPSMWVNTVDDEIEINENVKDMLSVFTKFTPKKLTISPGDYA